MRKKKKTLLHDRQKGNSIIIRRPWLEGIKGSSFQSLFNLSDENRAEYRHNWVSMSAFSTARMDRLMLLLPSHCQPASQFPL